MADPFDDELPLTGGEVDDWCSGLSPEEAGAALVLGGVRARELAAWSRRRLGFLEWTTADLAFGSPAERLLARPHASEVGTPAGPAGVPGLLRLQVDGNVIPTEIVPRLLRAPGVASAVLPVVRPAGALRRRRWGWPLRIAVSSPWVADDVADGMRRARLPVPGGGTHRLPSRLIDVHQLGSAGAVDLVVLDVPLSEAVDILEAQRTLANAVIVLDRPGQAWPVVDAGLAALRATTGAVASVLGPPLGAKPGAELARILAQLVVELSHAQPFDVAATTALERDVLIAGEPEALLRSDLASSTSDLAAGLREVRRESRATRARPRQPESRRTRATARPTRARPGGGYGAGRPPGATAARPPYAAPPPPPPTMAAADAPPLDHALSQLEGLAHGAFMGERHEASAIPDAVARVEELLREEEQVRFVQARVGSARQRNAFRPGANRISVFIGPEERSAVRGPSVSNTALGFTSPEVTSVRLTLVLVPLSPRGEPSRTEIDVPRFGRSDDAHLTLHVPRGHKGPVEARLVLLHWNRVVQTAVLSGRVGGEPAELTDVVVVHPAMDDLEKRRPFDAAFVLNHDSTGTAALIRHSNGHTWVDALPEIDPIVNRMRDALVGAAGARRSNRNYDAKLRPLVIELALNGRALFNLLEDNLGQLSGRGDPKRIQIVTARAGRFLPLELVYPRVAPADDAVLCARWKAGGTECGPDCFEDDNDDSVVCPAAFWGLSRVIERQYADSTELDSRMLLLADPKGTRKRLTVTNALLAASVKIAPKDVAATVDVLGAGTRTATTWEDWVTQLADPGTNSDLLVLMPHTLPDPPTMEISSKLLRMERLEDNYVTGRKEGVSPIVMLLGCDTAGSKDHPAGFCSSFMQKHAAVVFSTLTMIHVTHAPALSQQLVSLLRDSKRKPGPMGDLVTRFRREALQAGLVSALAVTAYGDADKKV